MPPRLLAVALAALAAPAQALCTSDGVPQAAAVLERFISADCAACWRDPATPKAGARTLALDWVLPAGEDAPLSAVAHEDAPARLQALGQPVPASFAAVSRRRSGAPLALRLAQGPAFDDHLGVSIALRQRRGERWHAWLLLVEELPAGTEGSPVARNLVRNVFRPDPAARLAETRTMRIREGAAPQRLRLVALLHDARGHMRAISRTECRE